MTELAGRWAKVGGKGQAGVRWISVHIMLNAADWTATVSEVLPDGTPNLYMSGRVAPRVG